MKTKVYRSLVDSIPLRFDSPEKQLLFGILDQAIKEFQSPLYRKNNRKAVEEIRQWFQDDAEDTVTYWSFADICEYLGLPKVKLRKLFLDIDRQLEEKESE